MVGERGKGFGVDLERDWRFGGVHEGFQRFRNDGPGSKLRAIINDFARDEGSTGSQTRVKRRAKESRKGPPMELDKTGGRRPSFEG